MSQFPPYLLTNLLTYLSFSRHSFDFGNTADHFPISVLGNSPVSVSASLFPLIYATFLGALIIVFQ